MSAALDASAIAAARYHATDVAHHLSAAYWTAEIDADRALYLLGRAEECFAKLSAEMTLARAVAADLQQTAALAREEAA